MINQCGHFCEHNKRLFTSNILIVQNYDIFFTKRVVVIHQTIGLEIPNAVLWHASLHLSTHQLALRLVAILESAWLSKNGLPLPIKKILSEENKPSWHPDMKYRYKIRNCNIFSTSLFLLVYFYNGFIFSHRTRELIVFVERSLRP